MKVLITGGAGFIGSQTAIRLKKVGYAVHCIDIFGEEDHPIKQKRVKLLSDNGIDCEQIDIRNASDMGAIASDGWDAVIHLAAIPGVRYSMEHPSEVMATNVMGTMNVFEACVKAGIPKVLYASSSSVYAGSDRVPFREMDPLPKPLSHYAASKATNEMSAALFHAQSGISMVGMRFFTVYGPWGRPDMACWKFAEAIDRGEVLELYGERTRRDFTYIDDVAASIQALMHVNFTQNVVYNVGNGSSFRVEDLVKHLSIYLDKPAFIQRASLPACDPKMTMCDNYALRAATGLRINTDLKDGVKKFVEWYKEYK